MPTDTQWAQYAMAVSRLGLKLDDEGREDVGVLLDMVERLVNEVVTATEPSANTHHGARVEE